MDVLFASHGSCRSKRCVSDSRFRSERAQAALTNLKDEFPNASITAIDCDLMDFSSVRKAADEIKKHFSNGIDILCNNAGIMADEDKATKDGTAAQANL